MIDLRSDTVTQPSPGMRAAMAAAPVGDDVFGEDPSVNLLQERAAALLGKEAALFVPSGSMANQIALKVHCQPGDDVVIGEGGHNYAYESGAAGAIAGVQFSVAGSGGRFVAADVAAVFKSGAVHHHAPTRLVCVENTHNRGGGLVWSQPVILEIAAFCQTHKLALHLDGARLLNAAIAQNLPPATLAKPFDTVSLCFSKGLGAPVGSVIAGSHALIDRAHRFRKMLGGGMRQAGILAAAALYALDHNVQRLADDHRNARHLAEQLGAIVGVDVASGSVRTNIVMAQLHPQAEVAQPSEEHASKALSDVASRPSVQGRAEAVAAALKTRGVLVLPFGPDRLRFVTHMDVDKDACTRAARTVAQVLGASPSLTPAA